MNKKISGIIFLLLLSALAVGCTAQGNEPPAAAANPPEPTVAAAVVSEPEAAVEPTVTADSTISSPGIPAELPPEVLGNAFYRGILDEAITLVNGRYEGEPFVEGGASRPTVMLMAEPVAYGDLNGDGGTDAAVVLVSDSGGSGTFVYLAAVESRDGAPNNLATLLLGDREQVRSLTIEDGRLIAKLLSHAADDPACCPSLETIREFKLQGETLVDAD